MTSSYRIAVVAHVRHPIAAPFKGGMEAHASALVRGLLGRGHEVRLLAAGDSDSSLPIEPVIDQHYESTLPWATWRGTDEFVAMQQQVSDRCITAIEAFEPDVVHYNGLFPALIDWGGQTDQPMLTSFHVPPFGGLVEALARNIDRQHLRFSTVSHAQLQRWAPHGHSHLQAIPNGIDLAAFAPTNGLRDGAVWAGRITPNKGTADACAAAALSGCRLDLYGPIEDETYFSQHVEPQLSDRIRYFGAANTADLARAYSRAAVAVVTPLWDEPFGLVAAEALACGAPIAGYANGALPEVVAECGRLVPPSDIPALADAIINAQEIDAAACSRRIREHYSIDAMLDGYERLYAEAIASRASNCSRTVAELA